MTREFRNVFFAVVQYLFESDCLFFFSASVKNKIKNNKKIIKNKHFFGPKKKKKLARSTPSARKLPSYLITAKISRNGVLYLVVNERSVHQSDVTASMTETPRKEKS